MQALVQGFMSRQPVAWLLFSVGAMVAVLMEMLRVPALIFALGMYLPLELNLPALVGGVLSHFVDKRSEAGWRRRRTRSRERGVIVASGFMAGGALGGVIGAGLRLFPWYREDLIRRRSSTSSPSRRPSRSSASSLFCVYLWRKTTHLPSGTAT